MEKPETESIDRLYLELSQFTTATTKREMQLENALMNLLVDIRQFDKSGAFEKLRSVSVADKLLEDQT